MKNFLEKFLYTIKRPFLLENKETETQWDFEIFEDTLRIRFEYSVERLDWKQNFQFFKRLIRPYQNMKQSFKVHGGFLLKYKSIQKEVLELVTKNIKRIEIFGFSQGAALGILAHEDIWFNFPNLRNNITTFVFGCPKVVSFKAPPERWKRVLRVENGNDIVTKVPFSFQGYKLVGNKLHIGEKRNIFKYKTVDHQINEYKKGLSKLK